VALGVVGESGHAGLAEITGSLYVRSDGDAAQLNTLWARTLERSSTHATLSRCATVRIALKPVP